MASLEAVVYPQDPFAYTYKDCYPLGGGGSWSYDFPLQEDDKALLGILDQITVNNTTTNLEQQGCYHANWDSSPPSVMQHPKEWDPNSSPEATVDQSLPAGVYVPTMEPPQAMSTNTNTTSGRRKRRRTKTTKNKEEIENQRMTHIAVERNRRKQMNEYLAVLRSLMPSSYVQRGDQASIVGGAINFVKELEQLLQNMEAEKKIKNYLHHQQQQPDHVNGTATSPFAEFFTFPQYSTHTTQHPATADVESLVQAENNQWAVADIEVTMVESHASLKILSKKRPRQLLKLVVGLQSLRLSILHLNVTTVDQMVFYSISVKVEEGCHLNTVDEIAAAVNQMLRRIEEEVAAFS